MICYVVRALPFFENSISTVISLYFSRMNLSYWEYKTWLTNIDFTIVGSGIVGLNCALSLQRKYPKAKIMVLEKGILPQGASTKNAGFACFGSISEILSDLKQHTEDEVVALVLKRWEGIQLLRKNLGDHNIDFQQHGGHELFLKNDKNLFSALLGADRLCEQGTVPYLWFKPFWAAKE